MLIFHETSSNLPIPLTVGWKRIADRGIPNCMKDSSFLYLWQFFPLELGETKSYTLVARKIDPNQLHLCQHFGVGLF
jgi:hypothetical protein